MKTNYVHNAFLKDEKGAISPIKIYSETDDPFKNKPSIFIIEVAGGNFYEIRIGEVA